MWVQILLRQPLFVIIFAPFYYRYAMETRRLRNPILHGYYYRDVVVDSSGDFR